MYEIIDGMDYYRLTEEQEFKGHPNGADGGRWEFDPKPITGVSVGDMLYYALSYGPTYARTIGVGVVTEVTEEQFVIHTTAGRFEYAPDDGVKYPHTIVSNRFTGREYHVIPGLHTLLAVLRANNGHEGWTDEAYQRTMDALNVPEWKRKQ